MGSDWRLRNDLSGWKVSIRTRYCSNCKSPNLNTKDGFFKLTIANGEKSYSASRIDICFCSECFKNLKTIMNNEKPNLMNEYNMRYKEAMVRSIERSNKNDK